MNQVRLTFSEFIQKFQPIKNQINEHAVLKGYLHESYGKELKHVENILSLEPKNIWTVVDIDGRVFIQEGFHHFDRLGYLVSKLPCEDNTRYEIYDETPAKQENIRSIDINDVVDFEDEDNQGGELLEWVRSNSTFTYNKEIDPSHEEFIFNLSVDYSDVPQPLEHLFDEFKANGAAYLLVHWGN